MKILIVSYFPSNAITPRAFRAKSLREQFTKLGHEVDLICLTDSKLNNHNNHNNHKSKNALTVIIELTRPYIARLINTFLPEGRKFFFILNHYNKIKKTEVDLVISIGLPFVTHLVTALAINFGKIKTKLSIADYGDPFSKNPATTKPFYSSNLERWVASHFDKLSIPTPNSLPAYTHIVPIDKLKIIPQGYNLEQDFSGNYQKSNRPTFAYAGVFYEKIRNPKNLLDYLSKINMDFEFHIYTDINNHESMSLIKNHKSKLGGKLFLHGQIPREDCIEKLSKMDFLINISNKDTIQSPSKLIDYALSSRPFFSIAQDQMKFDTLSEFLDGQYSSQEIFDISHHDEREVAQQFLI